MTLEFLLFLVIMLRQIKWTRDKFFCKLHQVNVSDSLILLLTETSLAILLELKKLGSDKLCKLVRSTKIDTIKSLMIHDSRAIQLKNDLESSCPIAHQGQMPLAIALGYNSHSCIITICLQSYNARTFDNYAELFLTLSSEKDDIIQAEHIIITDTNQVICWYRGATTSNTMNWYHRFDERRFRGDNSIPPINDSSNFGWYSGELTTASSYRQLQLLK